MTHHEAHILQSAQPTYILQAMNIGLHPMSWVPHQAHGACEYLALSFKKNALNAEHGRWLICILMSFFGIQMCNMPFCHLLYICEKGIGAAGVGNSSVPMNQVRLLVMLLKFFPFRNLSMHGWKSLQTTRYSLERYFVRIKIMMKTKQIIYLDGPPYVFND